MTEPITLAQALASLRHNLDVVLTECDTQRPRAWLRMRLAHLYTDACQAEALARATQENLHTRSTP